MVRVVELDGKNDSSMCLILLRLCLPLVLDCGYHLSPDLALVCVDGRTNVARLPILPIAASTPADDVMQGVRKPPYRRRRTLPSLPPLPMPGVIVHTTTSGRRQSPRSSRNNSQSVRLCDLVLKHVWISSIVVHSLIKANITKCIGAEVLFILRVDLAEMSDRTWISMTRVL